jgi:hypothetical protein
MTEVQDPEEGARRDDPPAGGMDAPEAVPEVAPEPASDGGRRRATLTALAGLAVAGAVAFGVASLGASDGAATPEEAVEAFFAAIDAEDAIGVVESLDPNEREILRTSLEQTQADAEEIEVVDPALDLRDVRGVELQVTDLTMRASPLASGVEAVDLTGGTVSAAADLERLPLGSVVREVIDRSEDGEDWERIEGPDDGRIDLDGVRLVTVQRDGGWHVSLLHSGAEAIRADLDTAHPYPTPEEAIAPSGAESPEAAVREGVEAAVTGDIARLVELAAPGEGEVLHTYGSILVAEAEESWGADGLDNEVTELDLAVSDGPDGRKLVSAERLVVTFPSEVGTQSVTHADDCTSWEYTYSEEYLDEIEAEYGAEEAAWYREEQGYFLDRDRWCDAAAALPSQEQFPFGVLVDPWSSTIVVEEHGGRWYVSPTRSLLESTVGPYRGLGADEMRRTARAIGGEWAYAQPDAVWEACGLEPPGLELSRSEAEALANRCYEQLPDDYEGPFGYGWYGSPYLGFDDDEEHVAIDDGFEELPEDLSEEPVDDLSPPAETYLEEENPADQCWWPAEGRNEATPEEVEACLSDLVASGQLRQRVLDEYRCDAIYYELDDVPAEVRESGSAEWDAIYDDVVQRSEACWDVISDESYDLED